VLFVLGTRPESIKLLPLIRALGDEPRFEPLVGWTGQHPIEMADVLTLAGIVPDREAPPAGSDRLGRKVARLIEVADDYIEAIRPDWVVVQGDTASALAGAMAAHYRQIPVLHVEAGLRSGALSDPWPEEANRQMIARIAALHAAPTAAAVKALRDEGVSSERIVRTGNTVIDALRWVAAKLDRRPALASTARPLLDRTGARKLVLVTAHRRENWGGGIERIAAAIRRLSAWEDTHVAWLLHPNTGLQAAVRTNLGGTAVELLPPLPYPDFVALMRSARLILTDSGGVQEEAPAFGVPVLVLRETTERAEAVEAGTARLVGTDADRIVAEAGRLLGDEEAHAEMARAHNPFGDGQAASRIASALLRRIEATRSAEPCVAAAGRG
jgi:UDP-N-acetylglucosamine 2-epimerase (non-hydrolysing)